MDVKFMFITNDDKQSSPFVDYNYWKKDSNTASLIVPTKKSPQSFKPTNDRTCVKLWVPVLFTVRCPPPAFLQYVDCRYTFI